MGRNVNPSAAAMAAAVPPRSTTATNKMGSALSGSGENFMLSKDNMPKLKNELEQKMRQMNDFEKLKNHVEMTITSEGLRIELMESSSDTFFNSGSAKLNTDGHDVLVALAQELGKLPNKISIEGHTDSKPYATTGTYDNWELSADRANAARRLMQHDGLRADQVSQVRGYADQMLRTPAQPLDASNRRISVIVQNLEQKPEDAKKDDGKTETAPPAATPPKKD